MSLGPAAQFRNQLIVPGERAPDKIYQTNQRYQEYLAYLGKQQPGAQVGIPPKNVVQYESVPFVLDPNKLSPVLKQINEENAALKNECSRLATDLVGSIAMVEKLIDDNISIKKHLDLKQMEMQHFLDSKQRNLNDEITDYKYQVQSLQEENSILIKHLEELKRSNSEEMIQGLQTELHNANELYDQLQANFQMCKEQEFDLAKQLAKAKSDLQYSEERNSQLVVSLNAAEDRIDAQINELTLLRNQLEILQRTSLDQIQSAQLELDEFKLRCNNLTRENATVTLNLQALENKHTDLLKENERLAQEASNFQMISDELYAKGKDLRQQLELTKLKKPVAPLSQKDAPSQQEFQSLVQQVDKAKQEYLKLDDFMNKQLEKQAVQANQILDTMKMKFNTSLRERQEQIAMLERQLLAANEEIEILRKEVELKKTEIEGSKGIMQEYQQLKRILDSQQMEIRTLKTTVQDKKSLISQMIDEKDKMSKLFKEEAKQHQMQLDELEHQLRISRQQSLKMPLMEQEVEKYKRSQEELEQKNKQMQGQYRDIQAMCKELNEQNAQHRIDVGILNSQINTLKDQLQFFQIQQQRKDKLDQVLQENQLLRAQLNQQ